MAAPHSLTLVDRGHPHVHRWLPRCACGGWVGVPRRRRREAEDQYRQHLANAAKVARREGRGGRRLTGPAPRAVTPPDQWPAEWRTGIP